MQATVGGEQSQSRRGRRQIRVGTGGQWVHVHVVSGQLVGRVGWSLRQKGKEKEKHAMFGSLWSRQLALHRCCAVR